LTRLDLDTAGQITDAAQIIAFRNVLIHGYDAIDDSRVWDAVQHPSNAAQPGHKVTGRCGRVAALPS